MSSEPADESQPARFARSPFPTWSFTSSGVEVRFVGRIPITIDATPADALGALGGSSPARCSWLGQQHSAVVQRATAGPAGEGDGLWTTEPGLALCIYTADCVPIVCGTHGRLVAIHAGWRGLVAGVIEASVRALPDPSDRIEAWLGPAIGPCCYEVGEDVAARVAACSSHSIATESESGRPLLDLHQAARIQLQALGVTRIRAVTECTRCKSDLLWSYRRHQGKSGRNLTLAWLVDRNG